MPFQPLKDFFVRLYRPLLPLRADSVQGRRFFLQAAFLALTADIGVEFHRFVSSVQSGGELAARPPGVDGFLPISSLMSLRLFALSGEVHQAHPAGFFILLAILAVSFAVGKSFCGWLCPFGFISELLYKARRRAVSRLTTLPAWLDYPLGALKYLILAFFVYVIFFAMSESALRSFLDGDYNKISDVRMYYFFARITPLAAVVTGSLFVLSYFIPYFWCRYLCPYGALLGLVSMAGPVKIRRAPAACTGCGECTAVCPQAIDVHRRASVVSDECTSCALCLDICPAPGALEMRLLPSGPRLGTALIPVLVALIFCLITGAAMLAGNWRGNVSGDDYQRLTVAYDAESAM